MKALTTLFSPQLPRPKTRGAVLPFSALPVKRERDFGVGYGSSSGYAKAAPYAPNGSAARFR
jgi:hypothetical protein